MIDVTFGTLNEEGCGYTMHKDILFWGKEQSVKVMVMCDDGEEITQFQRDTIAF